MAAGSPSDLQAELDKLSWYHTIDVLPGVRTRGMFDQRHALGRMPFPDVRGKRCLDIGTWDGFYAFELERRGAAEVVALDVPDLVDIDYPPAVLADRSFDRAHAGSQGRNAGFHALVEALDSKVSFRTGNIYALDPADVGTFDLVVVGSLLVHLRDPVRALDAVRKVTGGHLLSIDYLHTALTVLSRLAGGRPLFELRGETSDFQWWLASDAGMRHLLAVGGFAIERAGKPFLLRPGAAYSSLAETRPLRRLANRVLTGDATPGGHLHRAYLARPLF